MIDLRSDTVTHPTQEMRSAMANAIVGDDVFGEDPTVLALEAETAELLGKEAALFAPSGCMANQLALNAHAQEGDEVIVEADSHIFNYETTAASWLSRIQLYPILAADKGRLTPNEIQPAFRERDYYMPVSRLIALENTHNRAGGTVYPVDQIASISALAHSNGVGMHLDGARLWNACAYSGLEPHTYSQHFDTVAVCFSKGLGAPIGSILAGPQDLIKKAHRARKVWGGGMRQAGIIAAGALYALRSNRGRIGEDHINARRFAEIISQNCGSVHIDLASVQTNIVLLQLREGKNVDDAILKLNAAGLRLSKGARGLLRAVTHLDVTIEQCEQAAKIVCEVCG